MNTQRTVRAGSIGAAVLGLLLVSAGPASAHVTVDAQTAVAGTATILTVSVPHGCEGSPTTRVAVQIPPSITEATPTVLPGWQVRKVVTKLQQPIVLDDGDQITSRVDQVVYTADSPLPDGYRAAFELQVQLPADSAGQTLTFPTVQTCLHGEVAWTQRPAAGQDPDELEAPAPSIRVIAAADHVGTTGEAPVRAPVAELAGSPSSVGGQPGRDWGLAGLVAGLVGLGCGSLSLYRARDRARAR